MLTSEQVAGHEVSRRSVERLIAQGQWRRLDRSVYLTHPGEPTWPSWAWAGVLLGGDHGRLGGRSAGFVHGLVDQEPRPITVLVSPPHQVTRTRPQWEFRREAPGFRDRRSPGSPPRTTVEDTVLDLCDEGTMTDAVTWVTTAVQARQTTPQQLRRALRRRPRARHRRLLEDLLNDVAAGAESALELRYLRQVERPHGLPVGDRQNITGLPYRRDVVYRPWGLVVELDGRLGHTGMGRFRDMARDNRTLLAGEVTLRYGLADVADLSCEVAREVGTMLTRLGRPDLPRSCRFCSRVPEHRV